MELENKKPFAELAEFPYSNAYAIVGNTSDDKFSGILYKSGKKIKSIEADNLDNLTNQITEFMMEEGVIFKGKPSKINEGNGVDFPENKIQNLFPKNISLQVNNKDLYDELRPFYNLKFKDKKPDLKSISSIYGHYTKIDEKDMFFFKNKTVPQNLKDVVKPVVLPLYQNVLIPVNYLNYAVYFDNNKEYEKAFQMYLSTIYSSTNINSTTDWDRSLFRKIAYTQLSDLQNKISEKRNGLKNLYLLASELNENYINSEEAKKTDNEYSANLSKLIEIAKAAEENAREIRNQKLNGGIMAFTGALQSVNASGALTGGSFNNSIDYTPFFQSSTVAYANANQLQNNLKTAFSDIKEKINSQDFIIEGVQLENLDSPVAMEVLRFLTISPETSKSVLNKFAQDKTVLKKMIKDFYAKKNPKLLGSIVNQIKKIEILTSYFESRDLNISEKALAEF
ncbi:MAG: hypothetical protein QM564_11515 [Bergeyella sp.]